MRAHAARVRADGGTRKLDQDDEIDHSDSEAQGPDRTSWQLSTDVARHLRDKYKPSALSVLKLRRCRD